VNTSTAKFVRGHDRQTDEVTVQFYTSDYPTPHDWSGRFTLPKGRRAELGKAKLVLSDGRGGDVILYKVGTGNNRMTVDFWGLSPLRKVG
jgi:hypothetical protein